MTPVNGGLARLCVCLCASVFYLSSHIVWRSAVWLRQADVLAFAGTQSQMALHAERSAARATLANQSGAANPHFLPSPPKHTHINTHKLHTLIFFLSRLQALKKIAASQPSVWTPLCLWGISFLVFDWLKLRCWWSCTAMPEFKHMTRMCLETGEGKAVFGCDLISHRPGVKIHQTTSWHVRQYSYN